MPERVMTSREECTVEIGRDDLDRYKRYNLLFRWQVLGVIVYERVSFVTEGSIAVIIYSVYFGLFKRCGIVLTCRVLIIWPHLIVSSQDATLP